LYILLDIDGVLNTKNDWGTPYFLNDKNVEAFCETFQKDGKVILISSWRLGFVSRNNPSNSIQIKNLENKLSKYGMVITGVLNYNGNRGKAVYEFVKSHPDTICIDDDISEYVGYEDIKNLVLIDCKYGFRKGDYKCT